MSWVISRHLLLSSDWDSHHQLPQFLGSPESDGASWCFSAFIPGEPVPHSLSWLLSPNMHRVARWSKAELQWKLFQPLSQKGLQKMVMYLKNTSIH